MCFNGQCLTDTVSPSAVTLQPNEIYNEFDLSYTYFNTTACIANIRLVNPNNIAETYSSFAVKYYDELGMVNPVVNKKPDISLYPNPANTKLNVSLGNANFNKGRVIVKNILGQEIMQQTIIGNRQNITLNTVNLLQGIYYLSVELDDVIVSTKKIIIKH